MRIASLVPSATEALFALGLGEEVVAVTHECDHPAAVESLPRLTRSVVPAGLAPGEIDARVRELTARGVALYELDEEALRALRPDLIVTQALCAVCAVSYEDVRAVAARLPSEPAVLSLDPTTLEEVLDDLVRLADAAGRPERGPSLRDQLAARLEAVHARASARAAEPPRVAALEWLDPPFAGGHWVPQMIELAGGRDVLGAAGQKSRTVEWAEVEAARPEVVVVMPCGLYVDEAGEQALTYREQLAAVGPSRIVAVDAAASFSRPGPRLVDGVELLEAVLWRESAEDASGLGRRELTAEVRWASSVPSTRPR